MTRIPSKEAPRRISSWLIRDLEAVTAELIIFCHGMTNSESIASDSCPTMHPQKRPINFFLSILLYTDQPTQKTAPPRMAFLPFYCSLISNNFPFKPPPCSPSILAQRRFQNTPAKRNLRAGWFLTLLASVSLVLSNTYYVI